MPWALIWGLGTTVANVFLCDVNLLEMHTSSCLWGLENDLHYLKVAPGEAILYYLEELIKKKATRMRWFKNALLILTTWGLQMALLLHYKSGLEHFQLYSVHSWCLEGFFHCLFLDVLISKMNWTDRPPPQQRAGQAFFIPPLSFLLHRKNLLGKSDSKRLAALSDLVSCGHQQLRHIIPFMNSPSAILKPFLV